MSFPTASMTADIVVVTKPHSGLAGKEEQPHILLVERGGEPYKGMWALPGGFVNASNEEKVGERPIEAAVRELREETDLWALATDLEPVGVYTHPGRDPRGRVVTFAYLWDTVDLATYDAKAVTLAAKAGDDAAKVRWFVWNNLPELAFDHERIVQDAMALWSGLATGEAYPVVID